MKVEPHLPEANMIEPSFIDELDMDICGDFFDQIDDLLDFPNEDVEGDVVGGDCNAFQGIWPAPSDSLAGSNSVFSGNSTHNSSELPTELSVPHEDIAQLEWLSNFVEDSFSARSITLDKDYNSTITTTTTTAAAANNSDSHQFRTSSPVSVLESSSSCSGGKIMPLSPKTAIPGRARSKRPRPATFNPWPVPPLISPTSSVTDPVPSLSTSESENFAESRPSKKILKPDMTEQKKMKKKKKLSPLPGDRAHFDLQQQQPVAVRKCLHCEITKTPQWRAGPLGPKTLCNACGVRYKSGRLFPEYRPAASPTFVASLHSNSHKKVIEMRTKVGQNLTAAESLSPLPEFMPRSSHLPDYM